MGCVRSDAGVTGGERYIAAEVMKWRIAENIGGGIPENVEYWTVGVDWVFLPDWNDPDSVAAAESEARYTAWLAGDIGSPCTYSGSIVGQDGQPIDPAMISPCNPGDSVTGPVIMPANDGSGNDSRSGYAGTCADVGRACHEVCSAYHFSYVNGCASDYVGDMATRVLECAGFGAVCTAFSGGLAFTPCFALCAVGLYFFESIEFIDCVKSATGVRRACDGVCTAEYSQCCAHYPDECLSGEPAP
ncbi:MAG: hypothetical protein AABZ47_12460 [Planctomycetota bacterium]